MTQEKENLASVEEVARAFHRSVDTIKAGLKQGVFPWGYAVKCDGGKWAYIINRKRFEQIEMITLTEGESK